MKKLILSSILSIILFSCAPDNNPNGVKISFVSNGTVYYKTHKGQLPQDCISVNTPYTGSFYAIKDNMLVLEFIDFKFHLIPTIPGPNSIKVKFEYNDNQFSDYEVIFYESQNDDCIRLAF